TDASSDDGAGAQILSYWRNRDEDDSSVGDLAGAWGRNPRGAGRQSPTTNVQGCGRDSRQRSHNDHSRVPAWINGPGAHASRAGIRLRAGRVDRDASEGWARSRVRAGSDLL